MEWDIFYALEGTLIRVFWYKDRWHISTNKKLNAFKSRWSSRKSFGEMFQETLMAISGDPNCLETMLQALDPERVYLFLVRFNQENRLVCQPDRDPKEQVVFIGAWNDKTKSMDREWRHSPPLPMAIRAPVERRAELIPFVEALDIHKYQGIILFHKTQNIQWKIYPSEYHRLLRVRGNNPNIRFRYLEIRNDPEMRRQLFELCPYYQDMFLEYENILFQIAKLIRYYYIQRYIRNKYVTLPKEEYILMKKCHDWYLSNREENKINIAKVMEILNREETLALYKMIRRFQINQHQIPNNLMTSSVSMEDEFSIHPNQSPSHHNHRPHPSLPHNISFEMEMIVPIEMNNATITEPV